MTKLATELGQLLRKIRIETGEVLMDMSMKLGMQPAYLSAIELGKRNVPDNFLTNLTDKYTLSRETLTQVLNAIEADKRIIALNLQEANAKQVDATLAFARRVKTLSPQELDSLMKFLSKPETQAQTEENNV